MPTKTRATTPAARRRASRAAAPRPSRIRRPLRVGLFGIGLDTYWPQFPGLKERLEGYLRVVAKRLGRPGVEVVNLGLIDNPPKAIEAGHRFRRGMSTSFSSRSPPTPSRPPSSRSSSARGSR